MYYSLSSEIGKKLSEIREEKKKRDFKPYGITVGIHQGARKGKTLTAIMLSYYYLSILPHLKGVISNVTYTDESINYVPLEDIKMIGADEYRSYIIFTDEFRRLCDSRMSSSFKNMFISNILSDTGKFRQIHILTDQDPNSVDRRIRINADCVMHPIMNFNTGICTVKMFPTYNEYFKARVYDMVETYPSEFKFEFIKYFDYYDTEQKIGEYRLTFTPDDYWIMFRMWLHKMKYDSIEELKIDLGLLKLWKETDDSASYITNNQLSALLKYIQLEQQLGRLE